MNWRCWDRERQHVGPHRREIVAGEQHQAAYICWVIKRQRQGHHCPPGMAENDRLLDAQSG